MIEKKVFAGLFALCAVFTVGTTAQEVKPIFVQVDSPVAEIRPTMWGVFFEDINFAADGGLYAELVKNRSFEFFKPRTGWKIEVEDRDSSHFIILNRGDADMANPRFARITVDGNGKTCRLKNSGFRGMGIKKNLPYHFSVMASLPDGDDVTLVIRLVNEKGVVIGDTSLKPQGKAWKKYSATLTALATDPRASLEILFEGKGQVDVDMISLFPGDTWKNRSNGLRADLVQMLADLKPGFLRFPGGCIVEGYELDLRYQWKKTIGNPENREMIVNRWNTEFAHRQTPDYYQSFGLGFFEYFQLAEDIGAEPLPILNCGMACQFNSAEVVSLDQLDPYVQDALDLIEFANGSAETKWGKIRSRMGHPEPFNMTYLGIGNEQWGPQYFERYVIFEKAITAKYPDIILVAGAGPQPDGDLFEFAAGALKQTQAKIVDEHYYRPPAWFRENATRYDSYDRKGYKVFAGEYAAQSMGTGSPLNRNNWDCALSEAAFMTGLERNADVVVMCSYAPLFAHVDGWQWTPDLIWFDNLTVYGTPNYYVQKLFSTNRGTHVLSMLQENQPLSGQQGFYGSASFDKPSGEIILKLVNTGGLAIDRTFTLQTLGRVVSGASLTMLQHSSPNATNTIDNPRTVVPVEREITLKGKKVTVSLPAYSFSVIRIKLK